MREYKLCPTHLRGYKSLLKMHAIKNPSQIKIIELKADKNDKNADCDECKERNYKG